MWARFVGETSSGAAAPNTSHRDAGEFSTLDRIREEAMRCRRVRSLFRETKSPEAVTV